MAVAFAKRRDTARQTDAFNTAYQAALDAARALLRSNPTVETMRQLGGFTVVIRNAFQAAAGSATAPGPFNTTIPITTLLDAADVQAIRLQTQQEWREGQL
ncbi:MAG: hypothetical protein C5B54_05745 [Acidobacteria bacterium]|nr:MAG: hypothetical protein C5B54_05745 [Acidobacteriota bacterium]